MLHVIVTCVKSSLFSVRLSLEQFVTNVTAASDRAHVGSSVVSIGSALFPGQRL